MLSYNASSVPILQLALSSETIPEPEMFDFGITQLRAQLATVAGASIPYPYGGKQRQVQVDLDSAQLRAHGLAADDVVNAIGRRTSSCPPAPRRSAPLEYYVKLNASPTQIDELNDAADPRATTAACSTCATSRTCATATRRRPTSCASTASARS